MLRRMLYGYAGAILPLLLYVIFPVVKSMLPPPILLIVSTSVTPMLCVILYGSTEGLLLGFVISDRQRQFAPRAILMRTIVALVVLALWTALWFALKDYYHSKQGWASPVGGFLVAALASEFVFRESTRDEPTEKKL